MRSHNVLWARWNLSRVSLKTNCHPSRPQHETVLTAFASAPLPTKLFDDVTVLETSPRDRLHNVNVRFILFERAQPKQLPIDFAATFRLKMLNYIQLIATPTADTLGTCLLLHFDNRRYLFGNIAEGTQRAIVQRNIGIQKVEDVFLSGLINWRNAGGLLGIILTLADTLAGKTEAIQSQNEERQKKGKRLTEIVKPRIGIHGGKNIAYVLATARNFIFRKGLPLNLHEICDDPRSMKQDTSEPDWKDPNINVWYMPIQPSTHSPASPKKRTHEEFTGASEKRSKYATTFSTSDRGKDLVHTIVAQMFDSDWKMDALIETTLYKAELPAKLFIRDEKGHIQPYSGPLPGSGEEVPDIPVLVRQPWPGAMINSLPSTKPSIQSMCYIVKSHDRRGKFNPKAAQDLGVVKTDYKFLTEGQNVVGKDGVVVTPEMVLGETVPGNGFALVDLPDASYIDELVHRKEWSDEKMMKGIQVIFWILGDGMKDDSRLQKFMQRLSPVKHIVTSKDSCPNMIALESVAAQAFKLRCVDPDRFPLPVFDNEVSISNTPTTNTSPVYEIGRTGKAVQFSPRYLHQDDKITPFPDIEKLARENLSNEVLEMARQAKAKVSDPEFLAKIEEVESDIPHRDAEIITLGTGSALPSKYRNVSATLLRVPGCGNYLFDCGENTLGQLRRVFGNDLPKILRELKGIWISHLHADHHLGTASVIKAWHEETSNSRPSAKLLVASHSGMIRWLTEYADVEDFGMNRLITADFRPLDAKRSRSRILPPLIFTKEKTEMFGLKQVDACYVHHCFGSMATVFTFPTGLKVAYSGDCRPSYTEFVEIGKGATLLIHESTFDDELRGDALAKKHSTMSEAIEVGRRMGARRILLTHFSQRYQKVPLVEENLEIRPGAEDGDEVILVAFDYMRVKLGDFRKAQAFLPTLQKLFQNAEDDE
ncbi:beta-lactamase-like protein [Hypoxylon cercidicola]|nr:beta-lactamase-like protein [Hypoxylon cercidicola]